MGEDIAQVRLRNHRFGDSGIHTPDPDDLEEVVRVSATPGR